MMHGNRAKSTLFRIRATLQVMLSCKTERVEVGALGVAHHHQPAQTDHAYAVGEFPVLVPDPATRIQVAR